MLAGARVILVGSLSPLGLEIADRLSHHGARVVGIDHRTGSTAPSLVSHVVADMSQAEAAEAAVDDAAAILGGLDCVVVGAAVQRRGRVWDTTDETWRAVMTGTLDTTFHTLRRSLQVLRRGGAVVAISSVNADLAHPASAAYAASKGAINALVRQSALDSAPRGIRVNAVAPSAVDGPAGTHAGYPMGRTVSAREVADTIAFLASPLAAGITGVVLPVDGGLSITSAAAMTRDSFVAELADGANAFGDGRRG
ncbi:MAG TPA: SDR family oxidoreductase [Microbacterium sp.]|uniref:SDR family oxidoreductase n=1 Tax=unclassified Microbacterium TaxID=2609290 RepID=UPI002F92A0C0